MKRLLQRPFKFLALAACLALPAACVSLPVGMGGTPVPKAGASMTPVSSAYVRGIVKFAEDKDGTLITADFSGLLPGVHTVHLQDAETCATMSAYRADAMPKYDKDALGGLLLALTADVYGTARSELVVKGLTFEGDKTIMGRTVVLFAIGSDGRPVRQACGQVAPL